MGINTYAYYSVSILRVNQLLWLGTNRMNTGRLEGKAKNQKHRPNHTNKNKAHLGVRDSFWG